MGRKAKYKTRNIKYDADSKMSSAFTNTVSIFLFVIFSTAFYLVMSFKPMTKQDYVDSFNKMDQEVEPFRRNLTECARQVRASMVDVENFLKRVPQSTNQGKCFVACILKRNSIIVKNKLVPENLLAANKAVYGEDSEVLNRLSLAIKECSTAVEGIFEICEYSSVFNDCMHMKMEHILDKLTLERRMEALGQMSNQPDEWTEEEDELLKLVKDEL